MTTNPLADHFNAHVTGMTPTMREYFLYRIEAYAHDCAKHALNQLRNHYFPEANTNNQAFVYFCSQAFYIITLPLIRAEGKSTWLQSRINALNSLLIKACPVSRVPVALRIAKWLIDHRGLNQCLKAENLQYFLRYCEDHWFTAGCSGLWHTADAKAELKNFLERCNYFCTPRRVAKAPEPGHFFPPPPASLPPPPPPSPQTRDSDTDDDVPDLSPTDPQPEPEPEPTTEPEPVADDAPTTPAKGVSKPKLIKSLRRCGLDLKNIQRSRLRPTRKAKKFSNAKSLRFH